MDCFAAFAMTTGPFGIRNALHNEAFPNQSLRNTIEAIQPVISAMQAVTSP
jgi:hypothetical protein